MTDVEERRAQVRIQISAIDASGQRNRYVIAARDEYAAFIAAEKRGLRDVRFESGQPRVATAAAMNAKRTARTVVAPAKLDAETAMVGSEEETPPQGIVIDSVLVERAKRIEHERMLQRLTQSESLSEWTKLKTWVIKHVVAAILILIVPCCIYYPLKWLGSLLPRPSVRDVVAASAWDGSISQVEAYLRSVLRDPDSVVFEEWSNVLPQADGTFKVRCQYRAKNGFGGYVRSNQIFTLSSSGSVLEAKDFVTAPQY